MSRSPVKERTEGKHIGYGKVILFGEHFVVYGAEAIVAGISEYTDCTIEVLRGTPGIHVVDKRPAVPGYIQEKRAEQAKAHNLVLHHLGIDTHTDGLRVHLGGPLVPSSGIGASASDVVSLSRALSELYDLRLSEDAVNESAFIGEGGYHGTPSGVDNTAATFGGLISYRRAHGKATFAPIAGRTPLYLVVVGTGITASTTRVVGDVRAMRAREPARFGAILAEYERVVSRAKAALQAGNLVEVGALMNETHALCCQLDLTCAALESIVDCCRQNGALGAKLSGTGRGGIAVALAADAAQRDAIARALEQQCPAAKFLWRYTVQPLSRASL